MTETAGRRIKLSVLAGWTARIVSMACGLVNAGLLLNLLGTEGYAAQSILMSFAPWLALLNFGLPKAIQNEISRLRAEGKDYYRQKYSVCMAGVIAIVAAAILLSITSSAINNLLLINYNVPNDLIYTVCLALTIFGIAPIFIHVLFAEYKNFWPNVSGGLISLAQTALLLSLRNFEVHDLRSVVNAYVAPWAIAAIAMIFLVGNHREWKIHWTELPSILRAGTGFSIFALVSTATFNLDYVIMALLLDSASIVEYNLASKLFMAPMSINTIILTVCWTPVSDLYFSNNLQAVRKYIWKILLISSIAALLPAALFIAGSEIIVPVISAGQLTDLSPSLMWAWFALIAIRIWADTFAMPLMCMGKINSLTKYILIQTVISIAAQYFLAKTHGGTGIAAGLTISFLLTAAWIYPVTLFISTKTTSNLPPALQTPTSND